MVADFSKKQNREKDNLLLKTLAGIFLAIFILLIFANLKLYSKKKELAYQINNYSAQIQKIQDSNKKLQEEIANSGDKDYIEKIAREEANMQKPGEKAVSFIMPEEKQTSEQQSQSFWSLNFWTAGLSKFWQTLKNIF